MASKKWSVAIGAMVSGLVFVSYVPAALAFPHSARFGATTVYSVAPITPRMAAILHRADTLTATSPLSRGPIDRRIFLTDGCWRWSVLTLASSGAFGVRRPLTNNLIFNANDIATDTVTNGRTIGGRRTLSGTIAHETMHIVVSRSLGEVRAAMLPAWKREGYADYVARESSLSDADAATLRKAGGNPPPLVYYDARRRIVAALAANGGSVDQLLR